MTTAAVFSIAGVLATASFCSALAQQSSGLAALYDTDHPVTLVGEIVEVEWSTPRARLHVRDETTDKRWIVVGGSPTDLSAEQRASVRVGDRARVVAFQTRDKRCSPDCSAFGDKFTKADGSPLVTPPLPPHAH